MINFFRRIRQDLLNENSSSPSVGLSEHKREEHSRSGPPDQSSRAGKYLLYAVGEILLVVLGILIALQINNWNESRKLKKIEIKYLLELKSNLQVDLDDIRHSIAFTSSKIQSNTIVLNYLDGNEAFHDTLKPHFGNIQISLHFTPQTSAIEGIKTAEGINIIQSDSLRKALSYLYDYMYKHVMYIETEDEHRFQYDILLPALHENLKMSSRSYEVEPLDIHEIRNNSRFRNAINTNLWYKKFLLSQYNLQYKTVNDLIQLIKDELGNSE